MLRTDLNANQSTNNPLYQSYGLPNQPGSMPSQYQQCSSLMNPVSFIHHSKTSGPCLHPVPCLHSEPFTCSMSCFHRWRRVSTRCSTSAHVQLPGY
ncbi:hypothetical protein Hdeb2414_s0026g00674111 [Helianthus debilis subsp. tardiflorus]